MITFTQARDALVTRVNTVMTTHLSGLPTFYENTVKVDTNTVGDQFIQIEVSFEDTLIATHDGAGGPSDRVSGFVGFRLFTKEGKGSRSVAVIFDTLNTHLRHQNLSNVHTFSPVFGRKTAKDGWTTAEIGFPFTYYSLN